MWQTARHPEGVPDLHEALSVQHSTPEERLAEGNEIATFDDLDGLPEFRLIEISQECPVPTLDPDICVPCRAYAMVMDLRKEAADRALHKLENPTEFPLTEAEDANWSQDTAAEDLLEPTTEQLQTFEDELPDVRVQFANQVGVLNVLVKQLLEGPPIPPPNVTVSDLAALKIGAENWAKSMHKMQDDGFTLNSDQARILFAVESALGRMER